MTLDTFFEKFDLFADAPDAVAKMRRFILDLAVQGKLVAQDPKDEPADELLKRVQAEKARLVKSGEIKKQEQLPPVSEDAIPFSLPGGWAASQLGDVAVCLDYMREPINGTERDLRIAGKTQDELFPYYGATQQQGWIDDFIFDTELVLLGEDGVPFFDALRSKAYLISGKTWVNNHAHVFRGILVSNPYLMHWLNVFDYTGRVAGSTRSKLNQAKAVDIPIALPPLAEQKRIVAKVDELMALCDRLEAQQQEREAKASHLARASLARFADAPTPANLSYLFHSSFIIHPSDLRKSILTLAVQGKLVPQDPNDEPAASLLEQITQKKQAMIKAKLIRQGKVSRPHSAFDAPTELPTGWEWVNVDSLCFKVTDGTHFTPQYATSGVRFVSAKDIVSGKLVFDRCKFITREEHDQLYRRCNPEYHDIVISKSGSIGTVALVEDRGEFSLFESLALLKFDQTSVFPQFLVCALTHACSSLTTGHIRGVGVKHLHLDILRGLELALPPLAEQRRIVAKVEQLMALVDALETQLAASRATAAKLLSALVAELTQPS